LRLVARYADMSNFPKHTPSEQIPRKLAVLRQYCDEIGRDPATIVKTRKRTMVIAPSKREARRKGARQREVWGESKKRYRDMAVEGDTDQIADQVATDLAAGFDGIIFNITDDWDLDVVRLAGKALSSFN
jgi:alkanesulfonate monooxygenase SsuD/methylene tetrahydromethanopterin reductase-like flavin-dependent oxidoreductase (luciferase family)